MVVQGVLVEAVVEAGIDLLSRHAAVEVEHLRAPRRVEAFVEQQRVDREIAGQVPQALHAVAAPGEMAERAVQRLVRQGELDFATAQCGYPLRVEVQFARVGGRGAAPGAGRGQRQAQHQRAEKGLVEDQFRPRRGQPCRGVGGLRSLDLTHRA